jgi:hypothetical protein
MLVKLTCSPAPPMFVEPCVNDCKVAAVISCRRLDLDSTLLSLPAAGVWPKAVSDTRLGTRAFLAWCGFVRGWLCYL